MSLEAIQKIAAIEIEADKQRADALTEAKRITAAADASGQEMLRQAKLQAEADAGKLCADAESLGKAAAGEIAAATQSRCAALEDAAAQKMEAAVSIIVGRVVNG